MQNVKYLSSAVVVDLIRIFFLICRPNYQLKLRSMKFNITLLIMCFALIGCFGQANSSFDFVIGVDRSFRTVSSTEESLEATAVLEARAQEEAKQNWRIGANYRKEISDHVYLKLGARLTSVGYLVTDNSDLIWGIQHDGMGGFDPTIPSEEADFGNIYNDYWFVELPITVGYIKSVNKFSFYAEAGLSPNIYLTTLTKVEVGDEVTKDFQGTPNIRRGQLSGVVALGALYNLNEQLSVFVQPSYRYHLTNIANEGFINEHLYSYGVEFGLRKNL